MADVCHCRDPVATNLERMQLLNACQIFDACYEVVAEVDHLQRLESRHYFCVFRKGRGWLSFLSDNAGLLWR